MLGLMARVVLLTSALAGIVMSGSVVALQLPERRRSEDAVATGEGQAALDALAGVSSGGKQQPGKARPIVINTWAFTEATAAAWEALNHPASEKPALDAVEAGCSRCEALQCDGTVGFGGSPDETGETTLDAMIMDGSTMEAGAVSDLRFIKHAITTARLVMERTRHTMLAGLHATQFASEMGLAVEHLETKESKDMHRQWVDKRCQPNFRRAVVPDPSTSCGPYSPAALQASVQAALQQQEHVGEQRAQHHAGSSLRDSRSSSSGTVAEPAGSSGTSRSGRSRESSSWPNERAHDTISLAAVDAQGNIAAGCSTNGAIHKVPGRVGDGSTPGAGAYADSTVGACGATGDGDVHLRFMPCYQVVESMRRGLSPKEAAEDAILRIAKRVPGYTGALFALSKDGKWAGAAVGFSKFQVSYRDAGSADVTVVDIPPLHPSRVAEAAGRAEE